MHAASVEIFVLYKKGGNIISRFEELWDEFNHELLIYIKSKVNSSHDAEDILQDVSIKIFKSIDNLENPAAIKSWLYRVTKNTVIDFYKKKKDVSVEPEKLYFIEDDITEANNMNKEISECMKHMLFDLPDKYQEVYDMHESKGMKHKEIGEALEISLSASKVRLKRAKELFKENLLSCCEFEVDQYGNIIDYKSKCDCESC